jgi:hypothetical protein
VPLTTQRIAAMTRGVDAAPRRPLTWPTLVAFIAMTSLGCLTTPIPASAHEVDCTGLSGIEQARCERHRRMAARCGPIEGDAHFACDREFLLANPLDCTAFTGDAAQRCRAEIAAFQACRPRPGREFMRCVRDAALAKPTGAR